MKKLIDRTQESHRSMLGTARESILTFLCAWCYVHWRIVRFCV